MEIYTPKPKIKLSPVVRNGREFVEVTFGNDNDIRLSLSKEENVLLVGGRAYLPAENFVLAEFFDRYVKMAFIDYSAIKETAPRKEEDKRPPLPEGYIEKLRQVRYSDHTVRVYTSYFRDFQQHFEGRKIETVTPGEINDYLLYLIHEKNISSCQQNQRINAIKFYYEKVLGQERRCYKVNRAKREKTLPDVLSKEEIKKILDATVTDLRFFCMFSILYSAGLRISELLELKPGDINESRSLIRVRQGKGKKDRYTLLSKPLMKKLTEYNRLYSRMPEPFRLAAQIFRRAAGVQQLVGGMDAEVHERYIMYRRLGPADIFQQVETEFFPQVIVVPVPAEREGHMEDSFFHQHIRTFHQVEHELVPVAAEDGFHSRQVGREKPPEAGNIHHFRIDRDIGYPLCIEP